MLGQGGALKAGFSGNGLSGGVPEQTIYSMELKQGHYYRILAIATNGVGLLTQTPCPTPWVLVDTTPPIAGAVTLVPSADDLAEHSDSNSAGTAPAAAMYVAKSGALYVALSGWSDAESGLYAFYASASTTSGMPLIVDAYIQQVASATLPVSGLSHLDQVQVTWRAINHAGLDASARSNVVTIDATPPVIAASHEVADALRVGGVEYARTDGDDSFFTVRFSMDDPESGIASAAMCLGSFPGACDVLPKAVIDHRQRFARGSLALVVDGFRYYPTVFATNGAGSQAAVTTGGFTVDNAPPMCETVYDGTGIDLNWIGDADSVAVSWDAIVDVGSGLALQSVALRPLLAANGVGFEHVGLDARAAALVVPWLEHNTSYVSVVRATDLLGISAACLSNGFKTDFTPPAKGGVLSEYGTRQTVDHQVHFFWWDFEDTESGVREYLVAVGTIGQPERFAAFRSVGLGTEAIVGGLQLPQGKVMLTLRAVNHAGLHVDGHVNIEVDSYPPTCSAVEMFKDGNLASDGPLFAAGPAANISVSWSCEDESDIDPLELQGGSQWALGTFPGIDDTIPWTAAPLSATISLASFAFAAGQAYYVTVKVSDAVQLATKVYSERIVIDSSPPDWLLAPMLDHQGAAGSASTWSEQAFVRAAWVVADGESGVTDVRALVLPTGSAAPSLSAMRALDAAAVDGVRWSLPEDDALTDGASYTLYVCAVNAAGLLACAKPLEFTVDTSPPVCSAPSDFTGSGAPLGAFFASAGMLRSNWTCEDANGHVRSTSWAAYEHIGNGASTLLTPQPLVSSGANGVGVAPLSPAVEGARYYSCASAINAGGVSSGSPVCSAGAIFDATPPTIAGELHDTAGSGSRYVSGSGALQCTRWGSMADDVSGVAGATISVLEIKPYTAKAVRIIAPRALPDLSCTDCEWCLTRAQQDSLIPGSTYQTELRVTNGAGLATSVFTAGYTIDMTPPTAGTVDVEPIFSEGFDAQAGFPGSVSGIRFRISSAGFDDDESGIRTLKFTIFIDGNDAGSTTVSADVLDARGGSIETSPMQALPAGTTVQVEVVATNGAGLAGRSVASELLTLTFDSLKPGALMLVDGDWEPLLAYTTDAASFAVMLRPPTDPMGATAFVHTWSIVQGALRS